jgi:DNA polymerase/3'-5' exonuclease PolX
MGYSGNFESYKNLNRDNSYRHNNNKLSYWNKFKTSRINSRPINNVNKGFIRKILDLFKYGKLNRNIF